MEELERERIAERSARKSATYGSPEDPIPAAKAGALAGRRLRRASPSSGTISSPSPFPRGLSLSSIQAPSETVRITGWEELRHHAFKVPPQTQPILQTPHSSRSSIMALVRISGKWHGIGIADFWKQQLERLWDPLGKKQKEETNPVTNPIPTPTRCHSRNRT